MKKYELKPTDDNILITLEKDLLDRNKDLFSFIKLIQSPISSEMITLDGKWGCGKTFFVKQLMMSLNSFNRYSNYEQDIRDRVKKVYKDKIEVKDDILVVYYDAWKNDSCENPIVSIIYEISKQLSINFKMDNKIPYKVAATVIESITNVNINDLVDNLKSNDPLSIFKQQVEIEKQFVQFFSDVLIERGNKLVVIIDELDRCNPSFAVKLLEQVKHYVDDERVMFIVSTNIDELQHTVKHFYGESFDACKYLDKFFSLNVKLPPVDTNKYYSMLGLNTSYTIENNCKLIIKEYNMELREAGRFVSQVELAVYNPTHGDGRGFMFPDGHGEEMTLLYIVPLIIALSIVDKKQCSDFISGKDYKPLLRLVSAKDNGTGVLRQFLENNESFIEEKDKKVVSIEDIVKRWYNAIFVNDYVGPSYNTILGGNYEFDSDSKKTALSAVSLLSNYANYK